jgi:hypothetical protein
MLSVLCFASTAAAQPPVIVYPAGQYLVTTPTATSVTWTDTSVTLSWAVATPKPNPPTPNPPTPNPPVPPSPTTHIPQIVGTLYVIQLVDGQPTPAQAAVASSATIQPALGRLDAHWYAWTTKSAEAACWLDDHDVKATGYPALLLVTANGAGNAVLSYIIRLPDTEANILAIVQATRTKGRN